MLDRVNTNAVKRVVLDELRNPRVVSADNCRVLGVDIRKRQVRVTQPALLDCRLVVEVVSGLNEVFGVVLGRLVEGREDGEVGRVFGCRDVVDDDIDHQVHVAFVQRGCESIEVVGRAKVSIERVDVLRPVSASPEVSI